MVESHWEDVRGEQLRYLDHTWELTGDVDVLEDGDVLAVAARQVDGTRHDDARLYFDVETPPDSLNPGDPGDYFVGLVRESDGQYLRVETEGRTYRYELRRMEYE